VKTPSVKTPRILQAARLKDEEQTGGIIQKLSIGRGGYDETYADSLSDISHKLTIEAGLKGSYSGVTGSIESKFGLSGQRIEKTHFLKIIFGVSADGSILAKIVTNLKTCSKTVLKLRSPVGMWISYSKSTALTLLKI
jgi:hypothetical protein